MVDNHHRTSLGWKTALVLVLFIVSCSHGGWVLKAYDRNHGYTFVRNGVTYQTTCVATGSPILPNGKPDKNPQSMPPNLAYGNESACSDVLRYLGKPVPDGIETDEYILVFTYDTNYKLEFEIREAHQSGSIPW
jgi:hypothetical protein